jgi:hypothetical protein
LVSSSISSRFRGRQEAAEDRGFSTRTLAGERASGGWPVPTHGSDCNRRCISTRHSQPPKNGRTARSCAPSVMAVEPGHGRSKTPQPLGRRPPPSPLLQPASSPEPRHVQTLDHRPIHRRQQPSGGVVVVVVTHVADALVRTSTPLAAAPSAHMALIVSTDPSITSAPTSRSLLDNVRSLSCTAKPRPGDAAALDLCPGVPSGP